MTHSGETNVTNVTLRPPGQTLWGLIWKTHWTKVKQMQPMWLRILSGRQFEETFENAQWRKAKQMQSMWLCLFSGRRFEDTSENAQWRKVKQMQPMWLCLSSGRQFDEAFENTYWRKVKQMQPVWLCLHWFLDCIFVEKVHLTTHLTTCGLELFHLYINTVTYN